MRRRGWTRGSLGKRFISLVADVVRFVVFQPVAPLGNGLSECPDAGDV